MSYVTKSPWIIHYDGSSCNGCDIEVLACLTPMYDVERFGIINTGNPKHADIFVVTGSVNEQNKNVVKQIYEQMPEPKVVAAVGICACSGGVFADCYNVMGGVDQVIPVDCYIPGCAARPEAIIDGVVAALGVLAEKRKAMTASPARSAAAAAPAEPDPAEEAAAAISEAKEELAAEAAEAMEAAAAERTEEIASAVQEKLREEGAE